ncbi:MAG: hypothetical protein KatS3mg085_722 [Candidatus Dojkabacteria bacterium]|nr:MAG: hypothetical protein KatS3mg085_722 [Candidatus Dojkabacteria bacterium]
MTKQKNNLQSLNKSLFILNIILLVVFIVIQVGKTSIIGTKSVEIEEIRRQKDEIRLQTEILRAEIDSLKSLNRSESIAKENNLTIKPVTVLQGDNTNELASL